MDYEKKYNEALEKARKIKEKIVHSHLSTESCKAVSEYIDTIIPELAESEDEKIRKSLVALVEQSSDILEPRNQKRVLAYLEKQKEQNLIMANSPQLKEQRPLLTEETELNSLAFLEQMGYTCIPPKKEHQNNSDAPKNALGGALNSPLDKDKNLDDIAQDYMEAVKEYNPEPTWNLMQTAVCYGYHYREEEERKPAESGCTNDESEYDKGYREGHKFGLKQTQEYMLHGGKTFSGLIPCWVNAPSKLQPAHKYHGKNVVVMHENNGGFRCACIDDEKATTFHLPEDTLFVEGWRKKPAEWSEGNKQWLDAIIKDYEDSLQGDEDHDPAIQIKINLLKSLRPDSYKNCNSRWKPNEEQIRALEKAIIRAHSEDEIPILTELRQQLKKLM